MPLPIPNPPPPGLKVSWDFVDCSPFIDGTIKVLVKRGGNAYYQSFNFANARVVGGVGGGWCAQGMKETQQLSYESQPPPREGQVSKGPRRQPL